MRRCRGTTLIELLVAMAILVVLAVLSERSLTALSESQLRIEARREQWEAIASLFARIENDVAQAVDWGAAGPDGAASVWQVVPANATLALVRVDGSRDRRLRVTWRQQESTITMSVEPSTEPRPAEWLPVLAGVRRLAWRQMDDSGTWHDDWPWPQRLPRAVSVTLEMEDGTRFRRLFALGRT